MLISSRYKNDGNNIIPLNIEQLNIKNQIANKICSGTYVLESVPCVCGNNDFETIAEKDRYGLSCITLICRKCGLIVTNPRMNQESYDSFYAQEYRKLYDTRDKETFFQIQCSRGIELKRFIEVNSSFSEKHNKVLEIGCGVGGLLQPFLDDGYDVLGIDLNNDYVEFGKSKGIHSINCHSSELAQKGHYDIIILSHVVEHFIDLRNEFSVISRLINENGIIYIELPGIARDIAYDFLGTLQNAHTCYFSADTLVQTMGLLGYSCIFIDCDDWIRGLFKPSNEKLTKIYNYYYTNLTYLLQNEERYLATNHMQETESVTCASDISENKKSNLPDVHTCQAESITLTSENPGLMQRRLGFKAKNLTKSILRPFVRPFLLRIRLVVRDEMEAAYSYSRELAALLQNINENDKASQTDLGDVNISRMYSVKKLYLKQYRNGILNRVDIIARYLAIEQFYGINDYGYDLYTRMQKARNVENSHDIKKFITLIKSIELNGFMQFPIQVDNDFELVDGSHRMALALFFSMDSVPIEIVPADKHCYGYNFFSNCFSVSEIELLEKKEKEILENLSLQNRIRYINFKNRIDSLFQSEGQAFGRGKFYQSFEKLHIDGQRPTKYRFFSYGLDRLLNKEHSVLDIGCNCGFLSLFVSEYVKSIDGIELNQTLVDIANETKSFLGVNNCNFFCSDFSQFSTDKKYDVIFSFAVHHWINMPMSEYSAKLSDLLKQNGFVVFESQNIMSVDRDFEERVQLFCGDRFRIISSGEIIDDKEILRKFKVLMLNDKKADSPEANTVESIKKAFEFSSYSSSHLNKKGSDNTWKLHYGPGANWKKPSDEWLTIDIDPARGDIVLNLNNNIELPLEDGSVSAIYGAHVFEHVSIFQAPRLFSECYRVLCDKGFLRIVIPDVRKSINEYINGNTDYPLFSRRKLALKNRLGYEDISIFECLKSDFISPTEQMKLLGSECLAHQNAWDFEAICLELMRAGFMQERILLKAFQESDSPDFNFEGTYPSEANEYERSLYIEARK